MSVCAKCWADAVRAAYLRGGQIGDHYAKLLVERRDNPCPQPPTTGHEQHTEGEGS